MAKSKKRDSQPQNEDEIMGQMDQALRRMLNTPPETHKEMVARRRGAVTRPEKGRKPSK